MNDIMYVGRHALVSSVSRHRHESWEYVYCTHGTGVFRFADSELRYSEGDIVVIPPLLVHSNSSEAGMRNIYVHMASPAFAVKEPIVIPDDGNRFLLNAFTAAFYHYCSERPERETLLPLYGGLICAYLSAYQTVRDRPHVVEEIEHTISANYANCDWELDAYLRTLPFSYDYLRKLFQKEMGVTPHHYLSDRRLQASAELLAGQSTSNVADIARQCGFREPLYFSKMFKKKYGVAPSYYQRRAKS
ncbi:MAG: AraC family transcriptional regulator [Clostridia bacterium]|nr:AraC family transcriptional regulator [Clostridia bacterium]